MDVSADERAIINLHPVIRGARNAYPRFKKHFSRLPILVLIGQYAVDSLASATKNIYSQINAHQGAIGCRNMLLRHAGTGAC